MKKTRHCNVHTCTHTEYKSLNKSPDDVAISQPTFHQNHYTQEATVRVAEAEEIEKHRGKFLNEKRRDKES